MIRPPPRFTRTAPLFPYTTLVRADEEEYGRGGGAHMGRNHLLDRGDPRPEPGERQGRRDQQQHEGDRQRRREQADGVERHGEEEAKSRYPRIRSEEHTSELQSLMRISYAVFCLKQKKNKKST